MKNTKEQVLAAMEEHIPIEEIKLCSVTTAEQNSMRKKLTFIRALAHIKSAINATPISLNIKTRNVLYVSNNMQLTDIPLLIGRVMAKVSMVLLLSNIRQTLILQTFSSSSMSSYSQKQTYHQYQLQEEYRPKKKSPSTHGKRTQSGNQKLINNSKLGSVRILQKNTVYVIGLSPSIAREETLKRYEYFGQYGKILSVTINKDNAFQSENQGKCYSAYIAYSHPKEASIAILAVDQFVFDGRLLRASFGRTKYCKFFLKDSQCLNKDCPYQHTLSSEQDVLAQDEVHKKQMFQQCQKLALEFCKITEISDEEFKSNLKAFRLKEYPNFKYLRSVMPMPESIFEKKSLFKHINTSTTDQLKKIEPVRVITIQAQRDDKTQQKPSLKLSSSNNIQSDLSKLTVSAREQDSIQSLEKKILQAKRNNSSDERVPKLQNQASEDTPRTRVQTLELQLANSLQKHLAPSVSREDQSTGQTNSMFNEKMKSRFLSLKEDDEDGSLRQQQRMPKQKKGSMNSLIYESLKFLNDDVDDVGAISVQEQRIIPQSFNTNPPSEYRHGQVFTPARSHRGEFDDDQIWNYTQMSQQESIALFNRTQSVWGEESMISNQEMISRGLRPNFTHDGLQNSLYTSSYFLIPPNSNNGNQDQHMTLFNRQSSDIRNIYQRKATMQINNFTASSNHNPLARSPSQPIIDKILAQTNSSSHQNQTTQKQFNTQMSVNDNSSNLHSYDKQSYTLNQQNLSLFDKQHETSKDFLYAKIFLNDGVQSTNNFISSQSLFCYTAGFEEELPATAKSNYNFKSSMIPITPVKQTDTSSMIFDYFDEDSNTIRSSQPKDYYREFLNLKKDGIFGVHSMQNKRRNSFDENRDQLQPQQLQFNSPCFNRVSIGQDQSRNGHEKRSKSRSRSTHAR